MGACIEIEAEINPAYKVFSAANALTGHKDFFISLFEFEHESQSHDRDQPD